MDISYRIVRSSRKTVAIHITPAGEVEVRCPKRCSRREVDAFVQSKQDWICKHLQAIAQRPVQPQLSADQLRSLAQQAATDIPQRVRQFALQQKFGKEHDNG